MLRDDHPTYEPDELAGFDDFNVSLGDAMRGERATMGKSLDDVEFDLKIKKKYIEAIENSDASVFVSQGFISGYVRSYAGYLGMDAEQAFIQFCQESGYDGLKTSLEITPSKKHVRRSLVGGSTVTAGNDPFINPRVPNRPQQVSSFASVSLSGIMSICVLLLMIGGIGFGGWTVLQEVQRVQFAPVNSTPGVESEIAGLEPPAAAEQEIALAAAEQETQRQLENLYRPQELDVPQLIPRDGPIAAIDPNSFGTFARAPAPIEVVDLPEPVQVKVTVEGPPPVDIVAVNPAWIRVFQASGGVLFEKTLDAGQRYRVPVDVADAMLRAGNSGSVYVLIGDEAFGPVGVKTGVARKVDLNPDVVREKYATVAQLFSEPLAEPVNLPQTAEVQVTAPAAE